MGDLFRWWRERSAKVRGLGRERGANATDERWL
jgi:hypothetical protein